MNLNKLAAVTIAGTNSVYNYADLDTPYATKAASGFFNEMLDVIGPGTVINSVSSDGVGTHLFSNETDGEVTTISFLIPLALQDQVGALSQKQFITTVSSGNKIARSEIELSITNIGFQLPSNNITIYVADIDDGSKMYLCRYDSVQDEWYQELLKKAN